jgi:hypothetical protein
MQNCVQSAASIDMGSLRFPTCGPQNPSLTALVSHTAAAEEPPAVASNVEIS